jgi:hypothetical protein
MIGEYLRVNEAELHELLEADAETLPGLLGKRLEQERSHDPAAARLWDVDKTWDALRFLGRRAGFEVDIALGGKPFGAEFGYGPPRYLTAAQVSSVAEQLSRTGFTDLIRGVTGADLAAAGVYPAIWDEDDDLDYLKDHYESLVLFFVAAAKEGDAMVLILI